MNCIDSMIITDRYKCRVFFFLYFIITHLQNYSSCHLFLAGPVVPNSVFGQRHWTHCRRTNSTDTARHHTISMWSNTERPEWQQKTCIAKNPPKTIKGPKWIDKFGTNPFNGRPKHQSHANRQGQRTPVCVGTTVSVQHSHFHRLLHKTDNSQNMPRTHCTISLYSCTVGLVAQQFIQCRWLSTASIRCTVRIDCVTASSVSAAIGTCYENICHRSSTRCGCQRTKIVHCTLDGSVENITAAKRQFEFSARSGWSSGGLQRMASKWRCGRKR